MRIRLLLLIAIVALPALAAVGGCHGQVRVSSDPDDTVEPWDGDVDGARRRREAGEK